MKPVVNMIFMPCLRCGLPAVPVTVSFRLVNRDTLPCRRCDAEHYLAVRKLEVGYEVVYSPYTRRYPLEFYDEGDPEFVKLGLSHGHFSESETLGPGPIRVLPRKRNFKPSEVAEVWRTSKKRCHICGKLWNLAQRSRTGWHIDHIVPHTGGGSNTEGVANFAVACAKCNLSKGKGYTETTVKRAISELISWCEAQDKRVEELKKLHSKGRGSSGVSGRKRVVSKVRK